MKYKKLWKELKNKLIKQIEAETREYAITKDPIFKEWLSVEKWVLFQIEYLEIKEKGEEKNEQKR